jgi:hypothetical protein
LDGKRFFPDTGTPIWKMARSSTVFELCEPEPFAVATWIEKSLTSGGACEAAAAWVDELGEAVMELPGDGDSCRLG